MDVYIKIILVIAIGIDILLVMAMGLYIQWL
jgi:hypothetical protein